MDPRTSLTTRDVGPNGEGLPRLASAPITAEAMAAQLASVCAASLTALRQIQHALNDLSARMVADAPTDSASGMLAISRTVSRSQDFRRDHE